MSSNEFGTVNVRKGDRSREIDVIRQRYSRHRETLAALAAEAPADRLAPEYNRLIREIDAAIARLGEMEGRRPPTDTQPMRTEPGTRPLVTPPGTIMPDSGESAPSSAALPRVALIIGGGALALILIGWLMWRASGPSLTATRRTETTAVTETTRTAAATASPRHVTAALKIEPSSHDFGTIRKGTRAVRQFQVMNNTDQPVSLQVARSTCRCLYYDYAGTIAAHGKETLTVTVDAAKAKRGELHEALSVSAKKDSSVTASFDVSATVR
ncbi:MAG: hypothetical protein NVSMB68_00150 [Thermoanaerobaculia bacterium]